MGFRGDRPAQAFSSPTEGLGFIYGLRVRIWSGIGRQRRYLAKRLCGVLEFKAGRAVQGRPEVREPEKPHEDTQDVWNIVLYSI